MSDKFDSPSNDRIDATRRRWMIGGAGVLAAAGLIGFGRIASRPARAADTEHYAVTHTEAQWRALLTPAQFSVLREEGTERPYTSPLEHEKRAGTFACAGCDQALFASSTKFESGTGWPSFWQPLPKAVNETSDRSLGMLRTEVHCQRCGGHLGHVFDDGPQPTGLRYCMNGVAMTFKPTA